MNIDNLIKKYPHLSFEMKWKLLDDTLFELGQCDAIIKALSNTPIAPEYRQKLLQVSLIRGAQATTAIEGNTLTDEEIEKVQMGKNLPPSKEYQEIEVRNILDAFNVLLGELVIEDKSELISARIIKRFHNLIGKDLGEHLQAIPGKLRNHNIVVGNYRPPDNKDAGKLLDKFCKWSIDLFHFQSGQTFIESIVQAIVSHIYIALIHPFGDGNGRTARLLEFFILLRAGNPDFASHLLSNFYNKTRTEYYRQLDKIKRNGVLTDFISYAVKGYRDGLMELLEIVQNNQFEVAWRNYIHEVFQIKKIKGKSESIIKRRRNLMLSLPLNKKISVDEIKELNIKIAMTYNQLSNRTLMRDIDELLSLELVIEKDGLYHANTDLLRKFIRLKKG